MNNYKFTISPRAEANIQKIIRDANNVSEFLRSEGYLAYDPVSKASTRSLYEAYKDWCEDNAEIMLAVRSFHFNSNLSHRFVYTYLQCYVPHCDPGYKREYTPPLFLT